MINSGLGAVLALLVLALIAIFGYYRGFMALLTRRATLSENRTVQGGAALAIGLLQLAGAIVASAIAFLFYFSQNG
jgi:hypothetical protein